jgi:hypothetical protein
MTNEESALLPPSDTARSAFEGEDVAASRQYHDNKSDMKEEDWHQSEGGFLKPVIFGGLGKSTLCVGLCNPTLEGCNENCLKKVLVRIDSR